MSNIEVTTKNDVLVVDSRLIAEDLGIEHESFFRTIKKYEGKLEQRFGIIRFVNGVPSKPNGTPPKYALLTEPQAKFLLSKSRTGLSKVFIDKYEQIGFDFSMFERTECNRKNRKESSYSNKLATSLNGKREVRTLAGDIDVLTATEIIEVKKVKMWKHALGQVLVYGHYYPSHQKRIHLYGETQESFLTLIKKHCKKFKVIVTWES
jgi:phage regulator Rha-like protein